MSKSSSLNSAILTAIGHAVELHKRIHDESKEAQHLIEKLESNTNYRAILEQEKSDAQKFTQNAHAFAKVAYSWAENYNIFLNNFKQAIALLVEELKESGFVTVKTFPTFSITFNQNKYVYEHVKDNLNFLPRAKMVDEKLHLLAKQEGKVIQEIAEIISLEFQIEQFLESVNRSTSEHNVLSRCKHILSKSLPDQMIEDLHLIIVWWNHIKEMFEELKNKTYLAVEIDQAAIKQLKILHGEQTALGITPDQQEVLIDGLQLLGKLSLDIIPGGNFLSFGLESRRMVGLLKKVKQSLKQPSAAS